jgi:hypothetical protein
MIDDSGYLIVACSTKGPATAPQRPSVVAHACVTLSRRCSQYASLDKIYDREACISLGALRFRTYMYERDAAKYCAINGYY